MVNPITLESVSSAFERWRAQRSSRREKFPDELRQQALELLSKHTQSRVLGALKINHTTLKRWRAECDHAPMFVSLSTEVCAPKAALQITLRNRFGGEMQISGDLSNEQLVNLAMSFTTNPGTLP